MMEADSLDFDLRPMDIQWMASCYPAESAGKLLCAIIYEAIRDNMISVAIGGEVGADRATVLCRAADDNVYEQWLGALMITPDLLSQMVL